MGLVLYSVYFVSIDGQLQAQEYALTLRFGLQHQPAQVEISSRCPQAGWEFDPRPHLGDARTFQVQVFGSAGGYPLEPDPGCMVLDMPMRVIKAELRAADKEPSGLVFTLEQAL